MPTVVKPELLPLVDPVPVVLPVVDVVIVP
jgi:hypothetical protein